MRTNRGKIITIGNALVFLMFIVFGALSFFFFSPIIITNADGNVGAEISTSVNSVISAMLDTDKISTTITPTNEGMFSSQAFVVSVSTNSIRGYEIYFSSVDDGTDMTSEDSNMTISSNFDSFVTKKSMGTNTWGYSIDNENFFSIPTLSAQKIVRNIGHFPSEDERQSNIYIASKIGSDLKSGVYSKNVQFTAVAHAYDHTIESTMQSSICSSMNINNTVALRDERDNEMYNVAKLKDGRCWMTENLRIVGPLTLTSADSDVAQDFDLPGPEVHWGTVEDSLTTPYLAKSNNELYGVYYNYAATSAGTVMALEAVTDNLAYDIENSICPKGWKLPLKQEFITLFKAYGVADNGIDSDNGYKIFEPLMNFSTSGHYHHNDDKGTNEPDEWNPLGVGTYSDLWTATLYNSTNVVSVHSSRRFGPDIGFVQRHHGYGVRCIALDR